MVLLRLRELRDKSKLTQKDVASRLQLTSDAYSLYELGKRQMNYEILCSLADIYDVSIDYLLGRHDTDAIPLNSDEMEVVKQYRALETHAKAAIRNSLSFEYARAPKIDNTKKSAM